VTAPLFSLITIAYNDLNGLRRVVASVDEQNNRDLEHVIVDGGSTDGTSEYLESLRGTPWRRWSSEPDGGIYDAMNKGISRSSGRLVMMLNAGDCLAGPESLSRIATSFERDQWQWSYGAVRFVRPDGSHAGSYTFDPFHRIRFIMGILWVPHATVAMRRELLDEIGGYRTDLGSAADQELLMRALRVSEPTVIPEFLCHFERGGVSQQQSARKRELAWHRMRTENAQTVGPGWVDRLVSEVLAVRSPARRLARRLTGSTGMYSE
jgi:glycosyltransferase involved in cell wall biosynthesis